MGTSGKNIVYNNDKLKQIIQKSLKRQNDLKIDIRDAPKRIITNDDIQRMVNESGVSSIIPQGPMILRTNKKADDLNDMSNVLDSVVSNVRRYGLADGLKKTDASLIPISYLDDISLQ